MGRLISSEDNPLFGMTYGEATSHYNQGGGSTVYIDRLWYMNEGPGRTVNMSGAQAIQRLNEIERGTIITLDHDSFPRTRNLEPDEFAHNFYQSHGSLSDEAKIYGDTSYVIRGSIEVLNDGRYRVDIEIRPYDDQFGYENNQQSGRQEFFRSVGGWLAGDGTPYSIEYRGQTGARPRQMTGGGGLRDHRVVGQRRSK